MGLINDENNQRIAFYLKESDQSFKVRDKVEFEITLTCNGLTAINVVSFA
ncbi:hypothetical protein H7U22_17575 [Pedobacter sp. CCM 8938]|uniref:Uncharacterized protein n=2 Tax=Pedobacter fastidiosus TaxID=2765361 RepID=A0ABR7KW15_9SPHI|nr:hypothetical protein [Pedobacter fastidiosus]